ncbi:MAG: aminotransferase class V-fold PLP-dependent enzyme [Halanaerobiales bacterium]|nr:aminotransferase class V-fold PLP-dependent enzyme [Halanaerobiales bacterium]
MNQVYLDNAATTKDKPETVINKMSNFMKKINCSPGRGGYQCAIEAGKMVMDARFTIADFFKAEQVENIIFTKNITESLNFLIKGLLKKGDHVITTNLEHNAVLRPLKQLEDKDIIKVSYLKADQKGLFDPYLVSESINDSTKLILINHASNVTGTILPIEEIGQIASKHNVFFAIDTAQTAGIIDIDFKKLNLDFLGFTGHKSLLGPQGIGGMIISDRLANQMDSLITGGTGSLSESVNQPDFLPDKFESGTINTPGIVGLKAGIDYIQKTGIDTIFKHEKNLLDVFLAGLKSIKSIKVHGTLDSSKKVPTVGLSVEDYDIGELGYRLFNEYKIMVRSGLHCAPLAHKAIGTFPEGTLRFSIGWKNTKKEIEYTLNVLSKL